MSKDAGCSFCASNTGFNGIYVGGKINFNPNNPDLISIASQDFNGAYSTDGGSTWKYLNWSGKNWDGFCYGSYSINEQCIVAGLSDKWLSLGGTVKMVLTYDGGKTVTYTDHEVKGSHIGCGVYGANQAVNCRVNQKTHELWVTTHCCGIWKRKGPVPKTDEKEDSGKNEETNTTEESDKTEEANKTEETDKTEETNKTEESDKTEETDKTEESDSSSETTENGTDEENHTGWVIKNGSTYYVKEDGTKASGWK